MSVQHLDVLVIGAGLSGIGAGHHLQTKCPGKSYAILEGRDALGGTWDLFRYPGIRSDSDMYTLGYAFEPWTERESIADGASILNYLRSVARKYRIDEKIRFGHRVQRIAWDSGAARWSVRVSVRGQDAPAEFSCSFLMVCAGYYRYDTGHAPEFPGAGDFQGQLVHPQKWPEDLDYEGKRVVIIGSGATAVTLVPAMAAQAAHVTMLQRSPSYVMAMPSRDRIANLINRLLPDHLAYGVVRAKNIFLSMMMYQLSRRFPQAVKKMLQRGVRAAVGPEVDVATHFDPRYDPWDQRLCLASDGDFFEALRSGAASVKTDLVETFTPTGIRLKSGELLDADIIVTATGLTMQFLGGVQVRVDGQDISPPDLLTYKGLMFGNIPNLATAVGYSNASWTLKVDLTLDYVCRLLNYMDREGHDFCVPRPDENVQPAPFLDLSSGYIQRALKDLPSQGSRLPWKLYQNYLLDLLVLRYRNLDDGELHFETRQALSRTAPDQVAAAVGTVASGSNDMS